VTPHRSRAAGRIGALRLLFVLLALFAGPVAAQQRDSGAAPYARQLQRIVGQRSGPAMLTAVHAEGNMLVLTVNGGIGWRAFVPIARMSQIQLARYCRRPEVRGFFNGRRILRVDTTELGRNRWPGQPVARCP
jgi:hypothetical protein